MHNGYCQKLILFLVQIKTLLKNTTQEMNLQQRIVMYYSFDTYLLTKK